MNVVNHGFVCIINILLRDTIESRYHIVGILWRFNAFVLSSGAGIYLLVERWHAATLAMCLEAWRLGLVASADRVPLFSLSLRAEILKGAPLASRQGSSVSGYY